MSLADKIINHVKALPESKQITDQQQGKLRPALVLRELPGQYDDGLICMISSQLHQSIQQLDEIINTDDSDFIQSGLKLPSVIRASRLAVVDGDILIGKLGQVAHDRLSRVRQNLSRWISGAQQSTRPEKPMYSPAR